MQNCQPLSTDSPIFLDTFNVDFTGFFTANLKDVRQEHAARGGYLFRMGDLFLVCGYEEALGWGWTPEELKLLPCRHMA